MIPERIIGIGLLSALASIQFPKECMQKEIRWFFKLASFSPKLSQIFFWWSRARFFKDKKKAIQLCQRNAENLSPKDRDVLLSKRIMDIIIRVQSEA